MGSEPPHLAFGASLPKNCNAADIGFNTSHASEVPVDTVHRCGVALLRGAFKGHSLQEVLQAFENLNMAETKSLRYGKVREKRDQVHLPFGDPFDELELLGIDGVLLPYLSAALGPQFVLDLATIVTVPPGAAAQDPHKDLP